jgi:hypothetical protein
MISLRNSTAKNLSLMVIIAQFIISIIYLVYSYSLADPNFLLISWEPYWQFQSTLQSIFSDRSLLVSVYLVLLVSFFSIYFWWVRLASTNENFANEIFRKATGLKLKADWSWFLLIILASLPLALAYNALSYDLFNYIFNARMVIEYGANPHVQTALDFANDDWTRFMHNVHTSAPYGYGWTAISLLPYWLGQGIFSLTWVIFKLFALLSMILMFLAVRYWSKSILNKELEPISIVLLFANPLLLLEVLGNGHNDLWMLAPAMVGLTLVCRALISPKKVWGPLIVGLFLLAVSISIKLVTLVILPLVALLISAPFVIRKILSKASGLRRLMPEMIIGSLSNHWLRIMVMMVPLFASLLLFIPLLTDRSQQFHPWYLLWPLVWLPFINTPTWRTMLVVFSVSSLLRYLPWLQAGEYSADVILQQKMLTWLPAAIALFYLWQRRKRL